MNSVSYCIHILLIISYCILIHPVICNIVILWLVSGDWCRTRMRPARLVSNAFLYTTFVENFFQWSRYYLVHAVKYLGKTDENKLKDCERVVMAAKTFSSNRLLAQLYCRILTLVDDTVDGKTVKNVVKANLPSPF